MKSLVHASWADVEILRGRVAELTESPTLVAAASRFTQAFVESFDSVVLARLFAVLPFRSLPALEHEYVRSRTSSTRLGNETPCLCLLGTHGRGGAWCDRTASAGHLAIPLLDSNSVSDAPMIAKLLSDLDVDLKVLDDGRPIATRMMPGGRNGTFYVSDAMTEQDGRDRYIIPGRDFVEKFAIRTVFGMGGTYVDGTLVVAILFCDEKVDRLTVDRFPSFISSFKMATSRLAAQRLIFPA